MVECGCLETKTLKFCNDLEYRADMSTILTLKQKTGKNIRKPFDTFKNEILTTYKKEAILALVLKDTEQTNIRLE